MAISDYLNSLINDKKNLAANLTTKGVTASNDETFTTLVPKVLDIDTNGLDTSDATATPEDIKAGLTAYVNGEKITGTAYTRGAVTAVVDGKQHWLQEGFYNGGITIPADENLIPSNIKKDVTIYGTTGTLEVGINLDTSDATATADDIKETKTAYVNGEKITGTIPCVETETIITPSTEDNVLQSGFYNGITVKGDLNLSADNIKKGITLFGIEGTYEGETSSSGSSSYLLINTGTSTSKEDTVANYGDKVYIRETTASYDIADNFVTLNELVEQYGGVSAQNSYIGDSTQKYGVYLSNWTSVTDNKDTLDLFFINPVILNNGRLLLNLELALSTWLNHTGDIKLIKSDKTVTEDIIEDIKTKISEGTAEKTVNLNYLGSNSLNSVLFDLGDITQGTYYIYLNGFKKQTNQVNLVKLELLNF